MTRNYLVNKLWQVSLRSSYNDFIGSLDHVQSMQKACLLRILQSNQLTDFGKKYRFENLDTPDRYQKTVPLSLYDDYSSWLDDIAQGKMNVLTADKVRLFEPTSGTTSGTKYIPYNDTLKKEFQKAINPWIYSLYKNYPALLNTRSYWSISPVIHKDRYYGKIPVGFDDDSEYLGVLARCFYNMVTVSDPALAKAQTIAEFRLKKMVVLLAADDLGLISCWNPTFLTLLLDYFIQNYELVLNELARHHGGKFRQRASQIRSLTSGSDRKDIFSAIWPRVTVISCWSDALSGYGTLNLESYFPGVKIQPKGLLATEGIVSIPIMPGCDPALAVNSHFFEFMDVETGDTLLAHQLEKGRRYSVIITTGGGLYRYQMRDIVEITGFISQCPTMRFIGKQDNVSDLFGEKLNEVHVRQCLEGIFHELSLVPDSYMLVPVMNMNKVAYTLFIQKNENVEAKASQIARHVEEKLCENYHYNYCRQLGQLEKADIFLTDGNISHIYFNCRPEMKQGNIKPLILCNSTEIGEKIKKASSNRQIT